AWNFGPAEEDCRTVRWIVEHLARQWGGVRWSLDAGSHPHEARYLKLDSSKARVRLGWRPRWNLEQALEAIVEWHKAERSGGDVRAVLLDQIRRYTAAAEATETIR
ncbi:MAG TPA: CDP-glucose 4,6-dehydratase, partial [Usitatibacter sp.]|nr:CDP-glucose 4,6-dehydratase [Usitatibacter sp.]